MLKKETLYQKENNRDETIMKKEEKDDCLEEITREEFLIFLRRSMSSLDSAIDELNETKRKAYAIFENVEFYNNIGYDVRYYICGDDLSCTANKKKLIGYGVD